MKAQVHRLPTRTGNASLDTGGSPSIKGRSDVQSFDGSWGLFAVVVIAVGLAVVNGVEMPGTA